MHMETQCKKGKLIIHNAIIAMKRGRKKNEDCSEDTNMKEHHARGLPPPVTTDIRVSVARQWQEAAPQCAKSKCKGKMGRTNGEAMTVA